MTHQRNRRGRLGGTAGLSSSVWSNGSTVGQAGSGACHFNSVGALAVPGFCLLILLGCAQATERQALEGTVTLDGAPLAEGSILFLPKPGTKGPTSGGKITQGRFSISPAGGVFSGTFRVEITAVRNTGRKVMDPRMNKLIDEIEQFVPARYNRESELTAQVTEQGPNQFEFALK